MATLTMWMVRAGEKAWRIEEFERDSLVSIGWQAMGDMSGLRSRDEFVRQVERSYPEAKKAWVPGAAGQAFRFVREIKAGDAVLTYNPAERAYLVGTVIGDYEYAIQLSPEQPNLRRVKWRGRVARDQLTVSTRNSLGAISTLFLIPPDAASEIERLMTGQPDLPAPSAALTASEEAVDDLYKDIQAKVFEFIKDKVSQLDWEDMQELVAGLLRAMGYKVRASRRAVPTRKRHLRRLAGWIRVRESEDSG